MDSLGDRMKGYESAFRTVLPGRLPVVLRIDGRAFHTLCAHCERPFDHALMASMDALTEALCAEVQNCVMAYTQSDEISLLLVNDRTLEQQSWFGNEVQKMVSLAASFAGAFFNAKVFNARAYNMGVNSKELATFDCRAFVVPHEDVENYFVWRQQDWVRNSIQMLSRSLYSHSQLLGKSQADMHEMIHQKGQNWADLTEHEKNGRVCLKVGFPEVSTGHEEPDRPVLRSRWETQAVTPIFNSPGGRELVRSLLGLTGPVRAATVSA